MSTEQEQTMQFDEAQLAMLAPEERAALMDADDAPQEAQEEAAPDDAAQEQAEEAAAPEAAQEDAAPQQEAAKEEAPQQEEAPAAQEAEAAQQHEAEAAPEAAAPAQQPQQAASPYVYALPAEFAERAKALQERETELADKLAAGDIDATQFIMQQRELTREQAKLDAMQFRAEMAAEMQQQAVQRARAVEADAWGAAVQQLAAQLGDGAPDYLNAEADGMALAQQARAIMTARGMPDGAPVADKLSILQQAHKMVLLSRGQEPAPQDAAPQAPAAKPADAKRQAMAARKIDLSAAPASLGATPGADSGSTDAFARLDDLDGEKLEAALGKLARTDPAAYERWLAAA